MTGTQGTKSWKRLSGELHAAQDRNFDRAILLLARAIWPDLIQPEAMNKYDRSGVDLVAFNDAGGIDVAIQCKAFFKAEGLQEVLSDQSQSHARNDRRPGLWISLRVRSN